MMKLTETLNEKPRPGKHVIIHFIGHDGDRYEAQGYIDGNKKWRLSHNDALLNTSPYTWSEIDSKPSMKERTFITALEITIVMLITGQFIWSRIG